MGQPQCVNHIDSTSKSVAEQTTGSETSQYREEKRTIVIPLVAASEKGGAQTQLQNYLSSNGEMVLEMGVIRLQR